MLETIIVILVVLWLFGYIGPVVIPAFPAIADGNVIHVILVIAIILLIVSLARGRSI